MPNPTFKRWTADDVAKLKNLAQKQPPAEIAAALGRTPSATAVKAHELKLSLRMPRRDRPSAFRQGAESRPAARKICSLGTRGVAPIKSHRRDGDMKQKAAKVASASRCCGHFLPAPPENEIG